MQAIDQSPRIYERSRLIRVGPDAVYDYISDIRNLPTYLPPCATRRPKGRIAFALMWTCTGIALLPMGICVGIARSGGLSGRAIRMTIAAR